MQGVHSLSQEVLRTDVAGMPLEWIDYRDAVTLYHHGPGGLRLRPAALPAARRRNARTGRRTVVEVNSIVATHRTHPQPGQPRTLHAAAQQPDVVPARREPVHVLRAAVPVQPALARSHTPYQPRRPRHLDQRRHGVPPLQQPQGLAHAGAGASCSSSRCRSRRRYAEYIYLKGRRVLADQMEYLLAHFPRSSPLHQRLKRSLS